MQSSMNQDLFKRHVSTHGKLLEPLLDFRAYIVILLIRKLGKLGIDV